MKLTCVRAFGRAKPGDVVDVPDGGSYDPAYWQQAAAPAAAPAAVPASAPVPAAAATDSVGEIQRLQAELNALEHKEGH